RLGIAARDLGQGGGIHQLRHRGSPHAGIPVLARDLAQQLPLFERQLLNEREADRGVGVLVPRLRAKPIEDCHGLLQPDLPVSLCPGPGTPGPCYGFVNSASRRTTSSPCVDALTFLSMSRIRPSAPM